jgi:hypothetical protein
MDDTRYTTYNKLAKGDVIVRPDRLIRVQAVEHLGGSLTRVRTVEGWMSRDGRCEVFVLRRG